MNRLYCVHIFDSNWQLGRMTSDLCGRAGIWTCDPWIWRRTTDCAIQPGAVLYTTKTCLFKYTENFTTKKWKFSDKKFWYFSCFCSKQIVGTRYNRLIEAHILCFERWGGSNEYPQSMFWAEIRKIMYTPVNPSFTKWKWGLRGSKLYWHVFVMEWKIMDYKSIFHTGVWT